jgi:tRNA-dihydrouridine synthase A
MPAASCLAAPSGTCATTPKSTRGPAAGRQRAGKLAQAARLGEQWGYDEINLNCGCPSDRVQRGAFGASLMKAPSLVADCVKAMVDVVEVP